MKAFLKIMSLAFSFLLVFYACRKEQPEMDKSKNPCSCASEVSADFVIEESSGAVLQYMTETDTVLKNKRVHFTALKN